jgi:1-acyl-sn-glycerol-3-phosphate acyltransferase
MGTKKIKKFGKLNYWWIKWFFVHWKIMKYNVEAVNLDRIDVLEPPYLVMPNHMGFWDPFLINYYLSHGIHYVVSDAQFRHMIQKIFLSMVRSIPTTKMRSDVATAKLLLEVPK